MYLYCIQSHLQDLGTPKASARDNDAASNVTGSEAVTKTTLDDLFETLKKLEEEEQLASARPERKNAWCK